MQIPYELILGWRYTRAGRATRRNGFISFISGVSMLGIALGVAALIIVLSVMNGFQIAHWTRGGMNHWVISDLNRAEFSSFVRGLASTEGPG